MPMRDALTLLGIAGAIIAAYFAGRRDKAFWKSRYEYWYETALFWRDRALLLSVQPHPLHHRTIRVEASSPADAIDLLLTSARSRVGEGE